MTQQKEKIDFAKLCAEHSLPDLAARHGIRLIRAGREWKGPCPFHSEKSASFTIFHKGDREHYHCFGCGAHGDVVSFMAQIRNIEMREAIKLLAGDSLKTYQAAPRAETAPKREEDPQRAAKARDLYLKAEKAEGSPVESYLAQRGIDLEALGGVPASLRFSEVDYWHPHPDPQQKPVKMGTYPAMLAPIKQKDGVMSAVHITYLDPVRFCKISVPDPFAPGKSLNAKKVRGPMAGGCVRLGPAAETLMIAEGIESALSVRTAARGTAFDFDVWTCVSLGNLANIGLPDIVKNVIILADNDMKLPKSDRQKDPRVFLKESAQKIARGGRVVRVAWPRPGMDFNDVLKAGTV